MSKVQTTESAHSALCTLLLRSAVSTNTFNAMASTGHFKMSCKGFQCAHTTIDILMNYIWCISLLPKEINNVAHAYLVNVHSRSGGSQRIISDNGMLIKNKLFA